MESLNRVIQVDSREHREERNRIEAGFDRLGVRHVCSKLYVGDYAFMDNPLWVVDRKQGLEELAKNVCQDHQRFRAELVRAQEIGATLTILCEFKTLAPRSLEDVRRWANPRLKISPKAVTGEKLYKILYTMQERYGIYIEFCLKRETPEKILEILMRKEGRS